MSRKLNSILAFAIFCMFLLKSSCLVAQSENGENVFLQINTSNVLAGETLHYKFSVLDEQNKAKVLSKIGYVELFNSHKESVLKQKVLLSNGVATGDVFISNEMVSGSYKLVGYTNTSLLNGHAFQVNLLLINPYKGEILSNAISLDTVASHKAKIALEEVDQDKLKLQDTVFEKRSLVDVYFDKKLLTDLDFAKGNYTFSVRKVEASQLLAQNPKSEDYQQNLIENSSLKTEVAIEEFRGNVLSGKLTGEDAAHKTLTASLPGEAFQFKLATTKDDGSFYFVFDDPLPSTQVYVQPLQAIKDSVVIFSNHFPKSALTNFKEYVLSTSLQKELKERAIASQIENAYFKFKRDTLVSVTSRDNGAFYHPLQKVYVLDDFTRFRSVQETIVEIVKEVYFRKRKDKYTLHTRDYANEYSEDLFGETLIFIDGIIVRDTDQFFNFDARKIDRIEVVNSGYFYGDKLFNGMVSVFTKEGGFVPNNTAEHPVYEESMLLAVPEKKYFRQSYQTATYKRIPDYRYQLAWEPKFQILSSGYHFYTSDVPGMYEITLDGFKANGEPVFMKKYLRVQ